MHRQPAYNPVKNCSACNNTIDAMENTICITLVELVIMQFNRNHRKVTWENDKQKVKGTFK